MLSAGIISSCNRSDFTADLSDTTTSGHKKVCIDDSYQPLMSNMIETFMALYPLAKIEAHYKTEADLIHDFVNDSVKVIVSNKKLTAEQLKFFEQNKVEVKSVKIAIDAVAIIANRENAVDHLTFEQLQGIFDGTITRWKQIDPKSKADSIKVVFDNKGSCNTRFLNEKFLNGKKFPASCFALNNNTDVMNYVKENKNTLGVIGVNWISDKEDSAANNFMKNIKVLGISSPGSPDFYKPYQAYIALKQYPLTREVYIHNREGRNGLGTGFASFVAGEKGQRIVRLCGLLPATMPSELSILNRLLIVSLYFYRINLKV